MLVGRLGRSTRRFLTDRLERLHDALLNLGSRLRESIAQILGTHIGDAVRDAVENALQRRLPSRPDRSYGRYDPMRENPRYYHPDDHDRTDFWDEPREPAYLDEEPEAEEESQPQAKATRWKAVLTGLAQLAAWWVQRCPGRPSWKKVLGIGAAVAVGTLVVGPIIGGALMTVGTAVLLTRLTDGFTQATGRLAHSVTP